MTALTNRYEFVAIFEVINGNPNGDPDAGNMPRIDVDTGRGLVTDVSLKRKIRNYLELSRGDEPGFGIYVKQGSLLNEQHRKAYKAVRPDDKKLDKAERLNPAEDEAEKLLKFMCDNFYDVRAFGAVMTTNINIGAIRGPVQMTFATSVEPILPIEVTITRMAATNAKEKKERDNQTDENGDGRISNQSMGRKHIVPYALYRSHGFVSAKLAQKTGFTVDDLDVLLDAISNMFEHDHSAARGEMNLRKLIVFKHDSELGNAPSHRLFDLVTVGRNVEGVRREIGDNSIESLPPARKFSDYVIEVNFDGVPSGVTIIEKV